MEKILHNLFEFGRFAKISSSKGIQTQSIFSNSLNQYFHREESRRQWRDNRNTFFALAVPLVAVDHLQYLPQLSP